MAMPAGREPSIIVLPSIAYPHQLAAAPAAEGQP
jgi:hypothetical protein